MTRRTGWNPGKLPRGSYYNKEKADWAVEFFKHLKHTKGRWYGVPFNLLPWQEDILRRLFGVLRIKDDKRQYRTVYIEVPKKNGKSEFAAGIALFLLCADDEMGAEVYSAACDKEQAAIVYRIASSMRKQDEVLSGRLKEIASQKRLVDYETNSFYRVLSADVPTKHGLNVHGVIFDELHAQPNRNLFDVLTEGTGDAREQPVFFFITTAGYDRNSICWEQHDYALKVKKGIVDDPTFLPVVYSLPEKEDWEDKRNWKKVNPSLGKILPVERLRKAYKKAKETPALENNFRRLRLNQWTRQETRWLPIEEWDACTGIVDPEKLEGRVCYAGLDLASTTDIAAFVLVFPPQSENGKIQILPFFWIPEEGMRERSKKDRVPYDVWEKQDFIYATEGNVIHYGAIKKKIEELGEKYEIKEIAFDRWGAAQISQELDDAGFTVVPFGQGFASMAAPTKELLSLVLAEKINHGGNPPLRWMADNMVVKTDPAGNVKPDKSKSTEKIDGMVALIMGLDRAIRHKEAPSVYSERGIVTT